MAARPRESAHSRRDQHVSCPICASRSHWSFDSRFVAVHQCENEQCDHLFAVDVDSNHGVMHAVQTEAMESIYTERNERLVAFWEDRRFVTQGSKLLDVGAGSGHLARSLKEKLPGIEILCVEESESLRNQLGRQDFAVTANLDSISSNGSFDAVLLIEVIEHVPDPVGFLDNLRRHLDLEGKIFLTTPCGKLRNGSRTTNAYDTPEHVQFFTQKSLRLAVKKAGFPDIRYEYIEALYPRSTSPLSLATYKRLAMKSARPILARLQGPRHLTGFIDP